MTTTTPIKNESSPTEIGLSSPSLSDNSDEHQKNLQHLKLKLLIKHLRKSRVISLGVVFIITCLISAGMIEIYLRYFLLDKRYYLNTLLEPEDDDETVWGTATDSDREIKSEKFTLVNPVRRRKPNSLMKTHNGRKSFLVDGPAIAAVIAEINADINSEINTVVNSEITLLTEQEHGNEDDISLESGDDIENADSELPSDSSSSKVVETVVAVLPIPPLYVIFEPRSPTTLCSTSAHIVDHSINFRLDMDALRALKNTDKDAHMAFSLKFGNFCASLVDLALINPVYSRNPSIVSDLRDYQIEFRIVNNNLRYHFNFIQWWNDICTRNHSHPATHLQLHRPAPTFRTVGIEEFVNLYQTYIDRDNGLQDNVLPLFFISKDIPVPRQDDNISEVWLFRLRGFIDSLDLLTRGRHGRLLNYPPEILNDEGINELLYCIDRFNDIVRGLSPEDVQFIIRIRINPDFIPDKEIKL